MAQAPQLKLVKPQTEAEKTTRTVADTIEVTPAKARSWKLPPFQRPLKVNDKLLAIATEIGETQVIPGVLTLGVFNSDFYLIDGQHRREAFLLSELDVAYVDVRVAHFKTMGEMASEFYKLNSRIVQMKPDDYLRSLESSEPVLAKIRKTCPFVGYDNLRRGPSNAIVSMSSILRLWWMSSRDTPSGSVGGVAAVDSVRESDAKDLIEFLQLAFGAWGPDKEYQRLWAGLNIVICMWLYRRVVVDVRAPRVTRLTPDQFKRCLMALSALPEYLEWLRNRSLGEQSRSPAYRRIKDTFAKRVLEETGIKAVFPFPEWVKG